VLALVACLHITESVLIFISGRYGAVPIILRRDDGRLVGAFTLQNFWPLPLALLLAFIPEAAPPAELIKMPDWWPLLPMQEQPPAGTEWTYRMLPVVAALGYADIAAASTPARRRRKSAAHLALYSLTLLALAVLSARHPWLQFFAAVLSPLGHELLIQLDNRSEMRGEPRFVPPARGVMVLDTVPATPARQAGLRPGDISWPRRPGGQQRLRAGPRHQLRPGVFDLPRRAARSSPPGQLRRRRGAWRHHRPRRHEQYFARLSAPRFGHRLAANNSAAVKTFLFHRKCGIIITNRNVQIIFQPRKISYKCQIVQGFVRAFVREMSGFLPGICQ
jgi:hypothetical protein